MYGYEYLLKEVAMKYKMKVSMVKKLLTQTVFLVEVVNCAIKANWPPVRDS